MNRDPCYKDYLAQIGQIYFGQEKIKSGGLLSNLFQSLFVMKDDEQPTENNSATYFSSIDSNKNQDVDLD